MDILRRRQLSLALLVIIALAAFLRLWKLPESVVFLGDQGRDALVVSRIFKAADPVFIGPVTSVGNMYLGPLYYYFMLPFLLLSYPSPLGPVYAMVIMGIATVALLYILGRELVSERAALIAAALGATSSTLIAYSRYSWNPNPAPLFSLLLMYCIYKAIQKSPWYWMGAGLCLSVLLQLHYFILLAFASTGLIWLWHLVTLLKTKPSPKKTLSKRAQPLSQLLVATAAAALIVIGSLTPLILFDYKHEWLNAKGFASMISTKAFVKSTVDPDEKPKNENSNEVPQSSLARLPKNAWVRSRLILVDAYTGSKLHVVVSSMVLLIYLGGLVYLYRRGFLMPHAQGIGILGVFTLIGLVGSILYRHPVFTHYILYLVPAVLLLWGVMLDYLSRSLAGKILLPLLAVLYLWLNMSTLPINPLRFNIYTIQHVSETIYQRVKPGEKYNLAVLSETGDIDGQNYRYFLHTTDRPPVLTEQRGEIETLFIIDELHELEPVTASPIYEIVVFPDKTIRETYATEGDITITVLRKNP
jgi:4-amino-4-deoxy-L-arabinose transferase-like glycosyltransferase